MTAKTVLAHMIGTDGVGNNEVSAGAMRTIVTPFPPDCRASGVLMHVVSLPSPYGVGDLGPGALAWIDRLHEAGPGWWQA